jgi:pyruvate formate lyase activating enzyme
VACSACVLIGPRGAVSYQNGEIQNDRSKCIVCQKCAAVCPSGAREVSGKKMTAEEVVDRVDMERIFLEKSGGGITLSGGEVLAQPEFAKEILRLCRERGIHTVIETCGFGKWEILEGILKYTDLVLYDLKHMDSSWHREGTGAGNELILENAERIRKILNLPVIARVPLIPGFNDSKSNLKATAEFVMNRLGSDTKLHLLPYHPMGESKHERMEDGFEKMDIDAPSAEYMNRLLEYIKNLGIDARVGG